MNPFMQGAILVADRYQLRQANMVDLIRTAYGVEAENVLGGPSWLESDRFDVIAKAPPNTPPETLKLMLQSLLADRFKLVIHKDSKPMDAFVLSVGKGKLKLKEADGSGSTGCQPQPMTPPEPGKIPQITVSCHNMTMETFAPTLHQMAGGYLTSTVVDSTGLKGAWDFDIKWTGRGQLAQAGGDGMSIFDAVDKELGLKLEFQKFPTPVIVVDSVNQKPTDNPPGVKQTLPPPPPAEFEVAALKPSLPDTKPGGRGFQPGGRIDFQAIPLSVIITAAWDLRLDPGEDIAGAPKWVKSANFDLVAKTYAATGGTTNANNPQIDIDDLRAMLRALLVDRLKMVIHYEDRPQTAYTLVAAKPKLKKADPLGRTGCKVGPAPIGKDSKEGPPSFLARCQNMTMAQFAEQLPTIAPVYIHNPVLDASGIEGAWDFTLTFSPVPPNLMGGGGGGGRGGAPGPPPGSSPPAGGGSEASEPSSAVSLFDAIERQLGMKLEMHKRPLPVLVIDHIEEKPDN
jgi:uncharacterized protein (TIGR03435 family)